MPTFNFLLLGDAGVGKTTLLKSTLRPDRKPRVERSGPRTISFRFKEDFAPLYARYRERFKHSWDQVIQDWMAVEVVWHERQEIPEDIEKIDGVAILYDTPKLPAKARAQAKEITRLSNGFIPCCFCRNVREAVPNRISCREVYPNPLQRPRRLRSNGWDCQARLLVLVDRMLRKKLDLRETEMLLVQASHGLCVDSEDGTLSTVLGVVSDQTALLFGL